MPSRVETSSVHSSSLCIHSIAFLNHRSTILLIYLCPHLHLHLPVPQVQLDQQGRARKAIADLYRWRYKALGDLPSIAKEERFSQAVAGFARPFQLVDVGELNGVGESAPLPHYIQNLAEAEFVVATFMYMRLQARTRPPRSSPLLALIPVTPSPQNPSH